MDHHTTQVLVTFIKLIRLLEIGDSNALTGCQLILIDDENIFTFKYTSKGFKGAIPNDGANVSNIDFLGNLTVEKHHFGELKN